MSQLMLSVQNDGQRTRSFFGSHLNWNYQGQNSMMRIQSYKNATEIGYNSDDTETDEVPSMGNTKPVNLLEGSLQNKNYEASQMSASQSQGNFMSIKRRMVSRNGNNYCSFLTIPYQTNVQSRLILQTEHISILTSPNAKEQASAPHTQKQHFRSNSQLVGFMQKEMSPKTKRSLQDP